MGIGAGEAADALLVAPVALPAAVDESMLPKFAPTKPPMMS